jgi:diguanylate cyclase (GGDEF)-like protein
VKSPEIPLNEECRLNKLRSLNILDTPAEERFDRLTRLAKRMFNVPIALVSLIDDNRQWFKSCQGLNVSETPRDISFCGHAILDDEILMVTDTLEDERFADNPLVLGEPHIRFYAGCPLRSEDGSRLGTLCIIDQMPRLFNSDDLNELKSLAELVERELMLDSLAKMDNLTNILNRRGFITIAQNSLNLCTRHRISVSVVFLDLDKFKQINDSFGHAEGDKVLIKFAENMTKIFRMSDVIARLGGDEFAVLLTGTTNEQAKEVIDRFEKSIQSYNQEEKRGYDINFSDGIVTIDFSKESSNVDQSHSIEALLDQADALMYVNKKLK